CIAASRAGRTSLCLDARRPSACVRSFLCFLCAATPRFTRDIRCPPLDPRQQLADEFEVALGHECFAGVPALARRALVLVQVTLERLRPHETTASGDPEPLLAAAVAPDHVHLTSFKKRLALDDAVLLQLVSDLKEQDATAVRVRQLAAAEPDGDLELVAVVEEFGRGADLRVDVVIVDLRGDADLLPGHR